MAGTGRNPSGSGTGRSTAGPPISDIGHRPRTGALNGIGDSYAQGRALCSNIKNEDILLYTVAFRAPADAEAFLRGCANGPDHYFETTTGSALRQAFEEIAKQLRSLRLSS